MAFVSLASQPLALADSPMQSEDVAPRDTLPGVLDIYAVFVMVTAFLKFFNTTVATSREFKRV